MKIDLDPDTADLIVVDNLRESYMEIKEYSERDWESIRLPMYSQDEEEDGKKTKKLLKALKLVHNYYAKPANRI